jgi:hypothetical protein
MSVILNYVTIMGLATCNVAQRPELTDSSYVLLVMNSINSTELRNLNTKRMRIIKCGLNTAVHNDTSKQFFKDLVGFVHDVKTAAHLLCKAWLLEKFQNNEPLPGGL